MGNFAQCLSLIQGDDRRHNLKFILFTYDHEELVVPDEVRVKRDPEILSHTDQTALRCEWLVEIAFPPTVQILFTAAVHIFGRVSKRMKIKIKSPHGDTEK